MPKTPYFKKQFEEEGFTFGVDANDCQIPLRSSSLENEYKALREGIACADLSHVAVYRITGEEIIEFLDYTLAGDVGMLREENVLHTLCLNADGEIITEIYVVNDEEQFLVLAEGGSYADFEAHWEKYRENYNIQIEKLNDSHALFSIDGPNAWRPAKKVFGPEILGLRYLGFILPDNAEGTYVLRTGKTGEYGYWILTPNQQAKEVYDKLHAADDSGVRLYGKDLSDLARMENRFLNLDAEGKYTRNPYELGLFWTIQTDKEMVAGKALEKMLEDGIQKSTVGFVSADENTPVASGNSVYYKEEAIGQVVACAFSHVNKTKIGIALLAKDYCYVGLTFEGGEKRNPLKIISTPFLLNKSLETKIE